MYENHFYTHLNGDIKNFLAAAKSSRDPKTVLLKCLIYKCSLKHPDSEIQVIIVLSLFQMLELK